MSRFLPQNYEFQRGKILDDFQDISEWITIERSGTAPTVQKVDGGALFSSSGMEDFTEFTRPIDINYGDTNKRISIMFYIKEEDVPSLGSIQFYISGSSPWPSDYIWADYPAWRVQPGWNLWIHEPEFFLEGTENFDLNRSMKYLTIRIRAFERSGQEPPDILFKEIRYGGVTVPRLLYTFDDAWETVYTKAYPIMKEKEIRGTIYVAPVYIGTPNYMTLEQLHEMYEDGWAISNHTMNHTPLSTLSDHEVTYGRENIIKEIRDATDWLEEHGFTRSARHLAYPEGGYHQTTKFLQTVKDSGVLTARSSRVGDYMVGTYIPDNLNLMIMSTEVIYSTDTPLELAKSYIDETIRRRATTTLQFHAIDDIPPQAISWATDDFEALVQYTAETKIKTVTIDEWYHGLTNPRYTSLPVNRSIT